VVGLIVSGEQLVVGFVEEQLVLIERATLVGLVAAGEEIVAAVEVEEEEPTIVVSLVCCIEDRLGTEELRRDQVGPFHRAFLGVRIRMERKSSLVACMGCHKDRNLVSSAWLRPVFDPSLVEELVVVLKRAVFDLFAGC